MRPDGTRVKEASTIVSALPYVMPRRYDAQNFITEYADMEILRRYYDEHSGSGFDYAYRYPGMNKVLQAAGRVIRTAEDKGVVLLLDDRFARSEYTRLFPRHWRHLKYLSGTEQLKEELAAFW